MEKSNDQMVAAAGMLTICSLAIGVRMVEKRKRNQKRRSFYAKSWRKQYQHCGNIQTLLNASPTLSKDFISFKSNTLMEEFCFEELFSFIEEDIMRQDTSMRACVPAKERLTSTLTFLATGQNIKELSENTKLSPSFLRKNILEVCEVICNNMKNKYLKFPESKEKWLEIAAGFESLWQFPHCLGALDAKHIASTPRSVVLLAMCDANCKFTYVNIGNHGRISDGHVLMRSDLMMVLNRGETVFPKSDFIGNNRKMPYVIVADNAFPNTANLITPYSRNITQNNIINFNARLSRARQSIERAFGVLGNRFQIIQNTINLNANKTVKIVQCCCVLHNFLLQRSPWYRQSLNDITISDGLNLEGNEEGSNIDIAHREIENIRKTFVDYFSCEGNFKIEI